MEQQDREFLYARIVSGYLRLKVSSGVIVLIKSPTVKQQYASQEVYKDSYEEAISQNMFTEEEALELLRESGQWKPIDDKRIEQIPKDIEKLKLKIYESFNHEKTRESIRMFLRKAEEQLAKTYANKHAYNSTTCEGYASYCRWNWIIEKCTFYEDDTLYDWKHSSISSVLGYYQNNIVPDSDIRDIVRNDPWRSVWSSGRKSGNVFGVPAIELTQEQKNVIVWSQIYDSVQESPEAPSEELLSDDDAFDGYLIKQRNTRKSQQNKNEIEGELTNDKIKNSDEVFIMASDTKRIQKIESMNDDAAKGMQKSRRKKIKEAGNINHGALPDVKKSIQMDANEAFKSKMKGG